MQEEIGVFQGWQLLSMQLTQILLVLMEMYQCDLPKPFTAVEIEWNRKQLEEEEPSGFALACVNEGIF